MYLCELPCGHPNTLARNGCAKPPDYSLNNTFKNSFTFLYKGKKMNAVVKLNKLL